MAEKENPMRKILIEKVTMNMGVGEPGEGLNQAKELTEQLTEAAAVETHAKDRNPTFKLRKGLAIGVKSTLRGKKAEAFLTKALAAKKKVLSTSNFDSRGNFSFGIKEYIDFPGAKYNPKMAMVGFDVCVTLTRRGDRVKKRSQKTSKVGKSHIITKEEGIEFAKKKFDVSME